MRKLIAALMLCVLFLCCVLPAAVAEQSQKAGDYTYIIQHDGTAEIILYEGTETSLVIPQELNGIKDTAIGPSAFQADDELEALEIKDGLACLGDDA